MKSILPLLFLLLMTACSTKKPVQEGVITIDLTGNLSHQKDVFLSDIATDIEYIKLDNAIEIKSSERIIIPFPPNAPWRGILASYE